MWETRYLTGLWERVHSHRRSERIPISSAVEFIKRGSANVGSKPSILSCVDRSTRCFHWINFICVVALAAIGTAILYEKELGVTDNGKILLKTTHVWIGYVFAINLAWRITWAFIGNRQARWSAILPFHIGYGAAFKTYLRELIRRRCAPLPSATTP